MTDTGLRMRGELVPWADVYHLVWTRDGGLVATRAGMATVGREDAAAIERRIAPQEPERDAAVAAADEAEVAAWLGDAGRLHLLQSRGHLAGCTLGGGIALLVGLLLAGGGISLVSGAILAAVGAAVLAVCATQCGPPLVVDANGIAVGGRRPRQIAWSDLRSIRVPTVPGAKPGRLLAIAATRQGPLTILPGYDRAAELVAAVNRCVAFRHAAVPPRADEGVFLHAGLWGRRSLWLNHAGLHEVPARPGGPIPWEQVPLPEWGAFGPVLRLGRRRFALWAAPGGIEFARQLDQRLSGGEPLLDDTGALRSESIERWLGVAPGGSLVCGLRARAAAMRVSMLLGWIALIVWIMAAGAGGPRYGGGAFGVLWQGVVAAAGMLVVMARSARTVSADARGLSVRGRRGKREYYAWSEIESVQNSSYGWTVVTARGKLTISSAARNVDRIVGIIRHMLAEREFGSALPSAAPLPETALSRLRGDAPPAQDRGLSLSAEGET